jgi:hypothetical protein
MTIYETYSMYVLVISAVLIVIQLAIAVRSLTADHNRRKKEATIHYMNDIREKYRVINHELVQKFGKGPITEEQVQVIINDPDMLSKITNLLGLFEHMAAGVNTDVFDIYLLNRMSGRYLRNVYNRYLVYIIQRRQELGFPTAYIELEQLVNNLEILRKKQLQKSFLHIHIPRIKMKLQKQSHQLKEQD